MKKNLFLILIIILAIFLRIFKIDKFPATLYGDEQAFAWNAYSILKTGSDEYGEKMPLQFRSFNDYKAPIGVYILVPFFKFLDMNILSIRLPIVISSVITIFISFFLVNKFTNNKNSLIFIFLFTISPWHIHLSRGYFEATLALLFFILGIFYFILSKLKLKYLLLSMIYFALCIYSYFTPRILLPFFIIFLYVYVWHYMLNKSEYKKNIINKNIIISILFLIILSLPLMKASVYNKGLSRFNKLTDTVNSQITLNVNKKRNTSSLSPFVKKIMHNKATEYLSFVKNNYIEHLSVNYWYLYGDNSLRYFLGNMGMFYIAELPFFIIGFIFLFNRFRSIFIFFLSWILLAPIPASIVGRSFAVRSIAMLPAPFIFITYGVLYIRESMLFRLLFKSIFISLLFSTSLLILLTRYYFEYPIYASTWWGWENKAALDYAKKYEDNFDKIFISDFYTGLPLAYAVYSKQDPHEFRKAVINPIEFADKRSFIKIGKYYFGSLDLNKERLEQNLIPPNSLYIGRPEEADSDVTINAPDDGRILFKIYTTR